jgi:hypothetical protein
MMKDFLCAVTTGACDIGRARSRDRGAVGSPNQPKKKQKPMKLFRDLTEAEEAEFRQWARTNYKPFEPIDGTWHPVVQAECVEMNRLAEWEANRLAACREFARQP